jgi:hypothetical protein
MSASIRQESDKRSITERYAVAEKITPIRVHIVINKNRSIGKKNRYS